MPSVWMEHDDFVQPVPDHVIVELLFESGIISMPDKASNWTWDSGSKYRIVNNNEWIERTDDSIPVPMDVEVQVKLRNGRINASLRQAGDWYWVIGGGGFDIVAWRLPDAVEYEEPIEATQGRVFNTNTFREYFSPKPQYTVREHKTWKDREMDLLYLRPVKHSGYTPISKPVMQLMEKYGFKPPVLHYLHQGIHDKSMVSFTEDEKRGEANRQTVLKIGKYLKKYSEMTDPQIASISNLYRIEVLGNVDIRFARTREDIASVYVNGPSSCMSHSESGYDTDGIHPSEVYATPDISVAYIVRDNGRITARAVCNEIRKYYSRIYGDEQSLKPVLEALGYTKGDLNGCSLLRLTNDNGNIIAPFLDGEQGIIDKGNMLEIADDYDYIAGNTNGLLEAGARCDECGAFHHEDDLHYSEQHEMHICENCIEGSDWVYAYTGHLQDWLILSEDNLIEYDYDYYTLDALDYHGLVYCENAGNVIRQDEAVWCEKDESYAHMDDADYYVDSYGDSQYTVDYKDDIIQPEDSDEPMLEEDCTYVEGYFRHNPTEAA